MAISINKKPSFINTAAVAGAGALGGLLLPSLGIVGAAVFTGYAAYKLTDRIADKFNETENLAIQIMVKVIRAIAVFFSSMLGIFLTGALARIPISFTGALTLSGGVLLAGLAVIFTSGPYCSKPAEEQKSEFAWPKTPTNKIV